MATKPPYGHATNLAATEAKRAFKECVGQNDRGSGASTPSPRLITEPHSNDARGNGRLNRSTPRQSRNIARKTRPQNSEFEPKIFSFSEVSAIIDN